MKMLFPKHEAFNVGFDNETQALEWACRKSKFGGCYEKISEGKWLAYWLPKNHPLISEFAWS
jgi:hypothetical protein